MWTEDTIAKCQFSQLDPQIQCGANQNLSELFCGHQQTDSISSERAEDPEGYCYPEEEK